MHLNKDRKEERTDRSRRILTLCLRQKEETMIVERQVVVPIDQVPPELMEDALKATEHRWNPIFDDEGNPIGFHAPRYGVVLRSAFVIADVDEDSGEVVAIKKFQFDQMVHKDGPIADPYGHATPNAMAVVVEERPDGYWVWAVREWRPVVFDHRRNQRGVEAVGVTGGWAKKVGADPIQTALRELVEESGIEVDEATVKVINIHTPNRASVETCNEVILAVFKSKHGRMLDGSHDVIGDQFPVRLNEFPAGIDALVNSALWAVSTHLNCVSNKPLQG